MVSALRASLPSSLWHQLPTATDEMRATSLSEDR